MNTKKLKKILKMKVEGFRSYGDTIDTPDGQLTHIDNGANILGVAHLDIVLTEPPRYNRKKKIMTCPQLDDRLGVWTLLSLLPELGCAPFDVLLTEGEELGRSTAHYYTPQKEYNWIFAFDRAGTDVVMYDYEDYHCAELLDRHNFELGVGTFSDICFMEHLGIKGFNFGVGYHGQHTSKCFADLNDTAYMARKFCEFAKDMGDTKLWHHAVQDDFYGENSGENPCQWGECEFCYGNILTDWLYCPHCGTPT